jgi:hypothetical protein
MAPAGTSPPGKRFQPMYQASHWLRSCWPGLSAAALAAALGADARAAEIPVGHLGTLTCSMEREAADSPAGKAKGREALCEFRLRDGTPSETYIGTFQFAGLEGPAPAATMILMVKAPLSIKPLPGILQQSYAADASSSQDPAASKAVPLIGERSNFIVLQPEPRPASEPSLALGRPNVTILVSVELKLRSSTS